MSCAVCHSKAHSTKAHFSLKEKIEDKGFPRNSPKYEPAHRKADEAERKAFPSGYQKMKKIDENLPKDQLAGKNTKNGKLEVSKKVPEKFRKEVALHEKVESKALRKKK